MTEENPRTANPIVKALFAEAKKKRIPMTEVAKKINRSPMTMSYWKHGRSSPGAMEIASFAEAIGCEIIVRNKREG